MSCAPATAAWFASAFPAGPTEAQTRAWAPIAAGEHTLLLAPTGSGKTLAAFLVAIDRLSREPARPPRRRGDPVRGPRVVYVSPIKALAYDIEKNLRRPLAGIRAEAVARGEVTPALAIDVRTGDTSPRDRARQRRTPGDVLVTTPESLFLLVNSGAREGLRDVHTVIIDEIHAVAGTKRGVHLAVTLERLAALGADPQRIGLSATQRPLGEIARWLGGDRPVTQVDASAAKALDVRISLVPGVAGPAVGPVVEVPSTRYVASPDAPTGPLGPASVWHTLAVEVRRLILAHRTTIVFVNSRIVCERLVRAIVDLHGRDGPDGELVHPHHGSLSRTRRLDTEERLKRGELRGLVATSSLELGIDMGAVDLVVQVESPGGVSRALQRFGRASHQVGATSKGYLLPKFKLEILECAVVLEGMRAGAVEPTRVPTNCLDVLCQQIVAIAGHGAVPVAEVAALIRRAAPYRDLPDAALTSVLDLLAGRYADAAFADLRPRIVWDRDLDTVVARPGARLVVTANAGTIPDRGLFPVFLGKGGPRVGELDEEMVFESRRGDRVVLGASTWRVEDIGRDRVIVSPAPGQTGRMPFWHGDGLGRPVGLGLALGAFARELEACPADERDAWLSAKDLLDAPGREAVCELLEEQARTSAVPTDQRIVIERFHDELGDWRLCVLCPVGLRWTAPWAMAIRAALAGRFGVAPEVVHTDDGIAIRLAEGDETPDPSLLVPDPEALEGLVLDELRRSPMFASRFRECAARALLLPRGAPGRRTPLWSQRVRAQNLLAVVDAWPEFPIVVETFRECLRDVFDLEGLKRFLADARAGVVAVTVTDPVVPSPLGRGLAFVWVSRFLYDSGAPAAERRAVAQSVDRRLLREILGGAPPPLDADVVAAVLSEHRAPVAGPEALFDRLRRDGDLSEAELAQVAAAQGEPWLSALGRRVVRVDFPAGPVWAVAEDVGRLVALGGRAAAPVAPAHLAFDGDAVEAAVARFVAGRGVALVEAVVARYGLDATRVAAALGALEARGRVKLVDGAWFDAAVLRRVNARAREHGAAAVAAVPGAQLARFLLARHGVGRAVRATLEGLIAVVDRLEGAPIPWSDVERRILPSRLSDLRPELLDEAGATGRIGWLGAGALGAADGFVRLARRERLAAYVADVAPPAGLPTAVLAALRAGGAAFGFELASRVGVPLEAVVDALWALVWAGLVTNDTFQPLRSLGGRASSRGSGGRWSAPGAEPDPTRRAKVQGEALFMRYGVVGAPVAEAEGLVGGGAALVTLLRGFEDAGLVRSGAFVEGYGGAQRAAVADVDRLRAVASGARAVVLAATDPANPWGALLAGTGVRRGAGADVVLVDGACVLHVERGGKRWTTGPGLMAAFDGVLAAVRGAMSKDRARSRRIERIDGEPAVSSGLAARLLAAGAVPDGEALVVGRS